VNPLCLEYAGLWIEKDGVPEVDLVQTEYINLKYRLRITFSNVVVRIVSLGISESCAVE
jgi:hypothetical protein